MPTDPEKEKLQAALEQLEAERQRRAAEKIDAGKAVVVHPIVVGLSDSIAAEKARRIAELRAGGETREILFGAPESPGDVIVTGVPRHGRDKLPDG
jgi:hypothetical protein